MQQKYTIVVIDRDDSIRNIISDLVGIRYRNIRTVCTREISQIEELFTGQSIDLIIIDCNIAKQTHSDALHITNIISQNANNVPIILLTTKNSADKNENLCKLPIAVNLNKPFKPATLFLIIDKYISEKKTNETDSIEFTNPSWANFSHINLKILCETYSNKKEKIIKILKLFPESINPHLEKIKTLITKKETVALAEEFMSIRASFLYFSHPYVISNIDKAIEYIEDNNMAKVLDEYQVLCSKWSDISLEIEELKQ